ncbi:MAG: M14 family metallopeptidase, partial [Chloroflexota bacterium]
KNPQLVPADMSLYILRALNPDSAVLGAKEGKRLNANGVDLNRNFPVNWKRSWRSTGCSSLPDTAGEQPASEPETQALMAFLQQRPIELLVSYHSAFLGVAPSGDPPHAASVRLAQGIAGITRYPYPPLYTGCEYTGTLVDFAASTGVFAAVDLELNSVYGTELKTNLKVLDLLLTWQLPAR